MATGSIRGDYERRADTGILLVDRLLRWSTAGARTGESHSGAARLLRGAHVSSRRSDGHFPYSLGTGWERSGERRRDGGPVTGSGSVSGLDARNSSVGTLCHWIWSSVVRWRCLYSRSAR